MTPRLRSYIENGDYKKTTFLEEIHSEEAKSHVREAIVVALVALTIVATGWYAMERYNQANWDILVKNKTTYGN